MVGGITDLENAVYCADTDVHRPNMIVGSAKNIFVVNDKSRLRWKRRTNLTDRCACVCVFFSPLENHLSLLLTAENLTEPQAHLSEWISNRKSHLCFVLLQWISARKEQDSLLMSREHSDLIEFNCLGTLFIIRESSLNRFPDTLLGSSRVDAFHRPLFDLGDPKRRATFFNAARKQFIVDRHLVSFEAIINYYETGKLSAPTIYEPMIFFEELKYFQFDKQIIEHFYDTELREDFLRCRRLVPSNRILRSIWLALEYQDYSRMTKTVNERLPSPVLSFDRFRFISFVCWSPCSTVSICRSNFFLNCRERKWSAIDQDVNMSSSIFVRRTFAPNGFTRSNKVKNEVWSERDMKDFQSVRFFSLWNVFFVFSLLHTNGWHWLRWWISLICWSCSLLGRIWSSLRWISTGTMNVIRSSIWNSFNTWRFCVFVDLFVCVGSFDPYGFSLKASRRHSKIFSRLVLSFYSSSSRSEWSSKSSRRTTIGLSSLVSKIFSISSRFRRSQSAMPNAFRCRPQGKFSVHFWPHSVSRLIGEKSEENAFASGLIGISLPLPSIYRTFQSVYRQETMDKRFRTTKYVSTDGKTILSAWG